MGGRFPLLFSPGRIGRLEVKNRVVMAPMGTRFATADGLVTQQHIEYYSARARGGVGLVIVEAACVAPPQGKAGGTQLCISGEQHLHGLSLLADAIKRDGAAASIQLYHAGAGADPSIAGGEVVGPSAVRRRSFGMPRELSVEEIKLIVDAFVRGAAIAKKAGFDAVEVHGAHVYLVAEFISPIFNLRTDRYGGNIENRARIAVEIVEAIKRHLSDFPISFRLNACEYANGFFGPGVRGLTQDEATAVAKLIERAGADAVHVSCFGFGEQCLANIPDMPGSMLPLASVIKKAISVPVIAVGRMAPELGERALKNGSTDFVAFGRALIADPHLPAKARQGRMKDIAPCIGCNKCLSVEKYLRCSVNPTNGGEITWTLTKAEKTRKVLVIGGGPSGIEAACTAAQRGHKVMLFEAASELGGQLKYADKAPGKRDYISALTRYLVGSLRTSRVTVKLGMRADADLIRKEDPDAIIIATGASPSTPDIAGLRSNMKMVSALDLLAGSAVAGKKVVIIGGELIACETADLLSEAGRKVTLVRRSNHMATKLTPYSRYLLLSRLRRRGVSMLTGVSYREVNEQGLVIERPTGKEELLKADTIVVAAGMSPNRELYEALKDKYCIILAGDCVEPRDIREAIHEGFKAGFSIA